MTPRTIIPIALILLSICSRPVSAQVGESDFIDSFNPVPTSVLDTVGTLLPESSNAGAAYVSDLYDPNLVVTEPATVQVTFVWEGAGYRNTLGYFTYTEDDFGAVTIVDKQLILPNVSFPSAGILSTGDTVTLRDSGGAVRLFQPGERIGFFVVANGWSLSSQVQNWDPATATIPSTNPATNLAEARGVVTSIDALNPENLDNQPELARHVALMSLTGTPGFLNGDDFLLLGFEDLIRTQGSDDDFNDAVFIVVADPPTAIDDSDILIVDTDDPDGDGVSGTDDNFPNDPDRALVSKVPSFGLDAVGFEDSYPALGDGDYNDAVVAYSFSVVTDAAGLVKDVMGTFHLVARGAAYDSLVGLHLPGLPSTATGSLSIERFLSDDASTYELEPVRSVADLVSTEQRRIEDVFPSTVAALKSLPGQQFVNTQGPGIDRSAASARVLITFDQPVDPAVLGAPPYDLYFGIKNGPVPWDVHFAGTPGFADRPAFLPSESGASSFLDDSGYPWLLEVPNDWLFPFESVLISSAYPQFINWASSNGTQSTSWYDSPKPSSVTPGDDPIITIKPWTVALPSP